jgi:4'-phosphopantetheinyl transferase EntD
LTRLGSLSCRALEAVLPVGAFAVATRVDVPGAALLPEEEVAVSRAIARRRDEFATGRACARAALELLGLSRQAIPMGPEGEPRWPVGIVGSITHCDGYRACAVAREADVAAIGIDAEPNRPLPEGLLADVAFGDEPALVRRLAGAEPGVSWDRVLFSAKESVYKAWFPRARRRLGFEQVALTIDRRAGTFLADLPAPGLPLPDGELGAMPGRWAVDDGIVVTAVAVTPMTMVDLDRDMPVR